MEITEETKTLPELDIASVVDEHYNLKGTISKLDGYEDLNFLLTKDNNEKFIIKIACIHSKSDLLEAQNQILSKLNSHPKLEKLIPKVIANRQGKLITNLNSIINSERYLRVFSFLPGKPLYQVTHTKELFYDFGFWLGTLDQCLQGFVNTTLTNRNLNWDLKKFNSLENLVQNIQEPGKRSLVKYFISQYKVLVMPSLTHLRKSIIHSDANDYNVFCVDNRVSGIIDFGDAIQTHTINELAIALAYGLMNKSHPLDWANELIKGYHTEFPIEKKEIELLYYLIAARLCTTIIMSAYSKVNQPENEYTNVSEEPAWNLLQIWVSINPLAAKNKWLNICGYKNSSIDSSSYKNQELSLKNRKKHVGPSLSLSYSTPIKMKQGAFQYLYDDQGNTFVDCVNNVCHVGHCHPEVVLAGQKQMTKLNTNTRYLYDSLNQYAEELCSTLPEPLSVVYFVNSGSEATDLAVRMARAHTKQKDLIVVDNAYHGNNITCIEMSPYKFEGPGGFPKPSHIHKTSVPDGYRGKFKAEDKEIGKKYALEISTLLESLKNQDRGIAAFFCESLLSCGGQIIPPKNYLKEVYSYIRQAGGICVADEVQVGFGRVGTHFWGFETQEVIPDMVTLGKPMGNGHPLGAVVTTPDIAESFNNGMEYFNTYGGNPVSCEIGRAVLKVIKEEQLQLHAFTVGEHLLNNLHSLKASQSAIGDARGLGLFCGIELVKNQETLEPAADQASMLVNLMKDKGFLLSTDGPYHNVIKIKPPLCFSKSNADELAENLDSAFKSL